MTKTAMTGRQKAAALLVCLDRSVAVSILSNLSDSEIEAVTLATRELDGTPPDREELETILDEAKLFLEGGELPTTGYSMRMAELVSTALGPERSRDILAWTHEEVSRRPFEVLDGLGPREVAEVLKDEHPQFIAYYFSQIAPDRSATIINYLPEALRPIVIARLATQGATTVKTLARASNAVRSKVQEMGFQGVSSSDPGKQLRTVADILTRVEESTEKQVLREVTKTDAKMARKIKDLMFVFEDLKKLDRGAMQKILSNFEASVIAMSLKGTTDELQDFILSQMSSRARELVAEEKEMLGAVPIGEVLKAQEEILKTVRAMIESEEIKVRRGADEERLVE